MYDVDTLENKWKNYKSKKRRPWIIGTILLFLLLLFVVFKDDLLKIIPQYKPDQNTSVVETKKPKKKIPLKPYVPTLTPPTDTSQEDQNNSVNDDIKKTAISAEKIEPTPSMAIEVSEKPADFREHKRKYLKIEVTERYPTKKKQVKKPTRKKSVRSIKSVEKSFSRSGKSSDSLYLARAYYRQGNYEKAQKWALITNDINSKLEESWLIFVKAKAKSGQRREAEQILSAYIQKKNSTKAKALLRKMKKGKF